MVTSGAALAESTFSRRIRSSTSSRSMRTCLGASIPSLTLPFEETATTVRTMSSPISIFWPTSRVRVSTWSVVSIKWERRSNAPADFCFASGGNELISETGPTIDNNG